MFWSLKLIALILSDRISTQSDDYFRIKRIYWRMLGLKLDSYKQVKLWGETSLEMPDVWKRGRSSCQTGHWKLDWLQNMLVTNQIVIFRIKMFPVILWKYILYFILLILWTKILSFEFLIGFKERIRNHANKIDQVNNITIKILYFFLLLSRKNTRKKTEVDTVD